MPALHKVSGRYQEWPPIDIYSLINRQTTYECDYDYGQEVFAPDSNAKISNPIYNLHASSTLLAALTQPSHIPQIVSQPTQISYEILVIIVGNGENIPSITVTYFRTVGSWLPTLSSAQVQRGLQSDMTIDSSILLLCIYLATLAPSDINDSDAMRNSNYYQAKSLHTLRSSSGRPSLEIAQAAHLLALYENGNGMLEAAHVTMAVSIRISTSIRNASQRSRTRVVQDTELGNLWLGMVMLDGHGFPKCCFRGGTDK